jgi:type I restriction enzyme S subunit
MKKKTEVLRIVRKLRTELQRIYGPRLRGVYLFGSYARGDADDDSDIDVAIVLDRLTSRFEERQRCSEIRADLSLEHKCVINPFFFNEEEFQSGKYLLHRKVAKEGILI